MDYFPIIFNAEFGKNLHMTITTKISKIFNYFVHCI